MRRFPLALLAAASLVACSPPSSNDLTVDAQVQGTPTMQVAKTTGSLGYTYQLEFNLSLSLGQLASSDTDVTIQGFSLVRAADQSPLVTAVFGGSTTKTKHVGIGNTEIIDYKFQDGVDWNPSVLSQTDHDAICSGQVQVVGTVFDGARQKTVNVTSVAFGATCP